MVRLSARDEAKIKQYEELLRQEPNALVFAALASFYARKYEFGRAVEVLRRGLKNFPNYFSARVLLAKCYVALDHFDNAVEEINKVLAADPYNISALGLMGDELRNRGRLTEAREYYQKILEFEPENEEYAYKLELLDTIVEGGPFAAVKEAPAAAHAPSPTPAPAAAPATPAPVGPSLPEPAPETEQTPAEFTEEDLQAIASFDAHAEEKPLPEAESDAHELATLTLAKIYEDQGLFLRARDVVQKVLERDATNEEAQRALAHINELIAADESPTGASIIQLIHEVDAVAGVLEEDDVELWELTTAGVTQALAGFEEMTVAQAVAARAGVTALDHFVVPADKPALWEWEWEAPTAMAGEYGTDELWVDLPLAPDFDIDAAVNYLEYKIRPYDGACGTEEFALVTAQAPPVSPALTLPTEEVVIDIKRAVAAKKAPSAPPAPPPAAADEDEYRVRPELYKPTKQIELENRPFKGDDDFLNWLDSIKLKEI